MQLKIGIEEIGRSRKWRRRAARSHTRRFNSPLDQPVVPAGGASPPPPAATSPPPPPAAVSPPPPPAAVQSPSAGSGTSGLPTPGATPAAAAPGPAAPTQIDSFDQQFRQRYGMAPDQAQMLMTMGYNQYTAQGRPGPTPAAVAPAQQPANLFGLPQFDYRLLDFVAKNPQTGQLEGLPGAPPDAVIRVQAFQDQLRKAQQGFFDNPMQFLEKPIMELVEKKAQALYDQRFGQHQSQTVAQQIIAENSSWLYEKDAQGNYLTQFDPASGRHVQVPTAWGRYYHQCLQQIVGAGVTDPQAQHNFAKQMVENAALRAKFQQGNAAPAGNQAAQDFLTRAAANPPGAVSPPAALPPPPPAGNVPMTLKQRMAMDFDRNGMDDRAIASQMNGR